MRTLVINRIPKLAAVALLDDKAKIAGRSRTESRLVERTNR